MKRVSTTLLNHNTERGTLRCLKSLAKVNYPDSTIAILGFQIVNKGCYDACSLGHVLNFTGFSLRPPSGIPEHFIFGEDVRLCWVSLLRRYKCVIANKSVVKHFSLSDKKRVNSFSLAFHNSKNAVMNISIFFELVNVFKILPFLFALFRHFRLSGGS